MPRFIDETGNIYGKWHVLKKINNPKKNGALFLCRCECGYEQAILGKRLRAGETTQCSKCSGNAHRKNYAGYKFHKLTVLNEFEMRGTKTYWHCLCDCGNKTWVSAGNLVSGEVKSCGCLSHRYNGELENLTGRTFHDLTVIKQAEVENSKGARYWECICSCGNKTIVKTVDLTTGKVKSCGCRKTSNIPSGAVYGKLTVIGPTEKRASNGCIIYSCKCECGSICEVPSHSLIRGDWQSCGCGRFTSYNERNIEYLLKEDGIPFSKNQSFENLSKIYHTGGRHLEYDFVINNTDTYVIEYDGSQHFIYTDCGWDTEQNMLKTHNNDLIKNKFCFDNNIPLIRIPYDADYTLDDLKLQTTRFLLTPENEKQYYKERGLKDNDN